MLDIKALVYSTSIHPLTKDFSYTLYDEIDGYQIISGGISINWENTGTTPTTRCHFNLANNFLVENYGPNGESGWRVAGDWNNSNRTSCTLIIRAIAVREVPDPEPEPEIPEGGE
ncbi:hypothetical protein ACFP2T_35765 [Plantactinospora solaniradicis]|uniref:Uncharacterized protein n=1 Tax=Plantactinospora solaniradicis TaxID=1723736 RepID=A0ABW1KKZ4_9ACTN